MKKLFRRGIAMLLMLAMLSGLIGPGNVMLLTAYAEEESVEELSDDIPGIHEIEEMPEEPEKDVASPDEPDEVGEETPAPETTGETEIPETEIEEFDWEVFDEDDTDFADLTEQEFWIHPVNAEGIEIETTLLHLTGLFPVNAQVLVDVLDFTAVENAVEAYSVFILSGDQPWQPVYDPITVQIYSDAVNTALAEGLLPEVWEVRYPADAAEPLCLPYGEMAAVDETGALCFDAWYFEILEIAVSAAPTEEPVTEAEEVSEIDEEPAEEPAEEVAEEPAEDSDGDEAPEEEPVLVRNALSMSMGERVESLVDGVDTALTAAKGNTVIYHYETEGETVTITVDGTHQNNQIPEVRAASVQADETRRVLEAWTVDNLKKKASLTLTAAVTALPELEEGESLAICTVTGDALGETLRENLSVDDTVELTLDMKGPTGIAVVVTAAAKDPDDETVIPDNTIWANDDLYLTGKMPKNAVVTAEPVTVTIDGENVLAAWDIKIYANENQRQMGKTWQPAGDKVQVHVRSDAFRDMEDELNVYHLADAESEAELVTTVTASDSWIAFDAESFSTYVISAVLEKTITATDGNTYKITVAYDSASGIPAGAELEVSEITDPAVYRTYLDSAVETLGVSLESLTYTRLFDITVVGPDGQSCQPNDTVSVTVELMEPEAKTVDNMRVVHFGGAAEKPAAEAKLMSVMRAANADGAAEELTAKTADGTVTFETEGFSVFSFLDTSVIDRVAGAIFGTDSKLYENDDIILTGRMPLFGTVEAAPATVELEGKKVLLAYDIKIYANSLMKLLGIAWQPSEGAIQVTMKSDELKEEAVDVYHIKDGDSEAELVSESLTVENNSVTFAADSFSVYVLTPESYHRTYRFFTLDENGQYVEYTLYTDQGTTTFTQNIKNGESLVVPQLPAIPGSSTSTFSGWYAGAGDVSTQPIDPSDITLESTEFDFENIPPITVNGEEVLLFARFADYAYVVFHDQYNGSTGTFPVAMTRRGEKTGGTANVTISDVSVAYDDSSDENTQTQMAFYGWSYTPVTTAGAKVDDNGDPIVRIETDAIEVPNAYTDPATGATNLYPIFTPIHWLSYYSGPSGSGATYIPSKYFYLDEGPSSLSVPVRSGYTFQGWYTGSVDGGDNVTYATRISNADGSLITGVNDTVYGARVEDGVLLLTEDVQLFARWEVAPVNYTVVIWRQKATDAANLADANKTYDFAESVIRTATTGETVSVTNDDKRLAGSGEYVGFHYSRCDDSATVRGDGSTVLNVYYDRNVHTLTFRVGNSTVKTITELYGHNIAGYFPITGTNGTSYNGYYWQASDTSVYRYILATIETMPNADVRFSSNGSGTSKTIYYYVEIGGQSESLGTTRTFNNKLYTLYKTVNHNFRYLTYDEEYHPIEGYVRSRTNAEPAFNASNNQASIGAGNVNYLYYDRDEFSISFLDSYTRQNVYVSDSQVATVPVKFCEAISGHVPGTPSPKQIVTVDGVPTAQDRPGYTFTGWYTDEACSTRVFFDADDPTYQAYLAAGTNCVLYDKMPAHNLRVYAGWETEWYLIKMDPNGGSGLDSDTHGSTWFWEAYNGDPIEEYTWVTRNYVESRDGTFYYVLHDRAYYGYSDEYVSGESGERSVYYTEDLNQATSLTTYKYAENAYRYAGWYEVLFDADGNEIGEELYSFGDPVTHNTTLRLHWKKIGTYYVSYDAGIGTIDTGDSNETLFFELDGDDYADNAEVVVSRTARAPEGYNFAGWVIRGDPDGKVYLPGQTFTFKAKDAVTVNGRETIYLDAVYTRVGTAKIIYNANGGTITETGLDYGAPTDAAAPTPATASDAAAGTATVSNLVNNSEFRLSDGSGFALEGAILVGWSTEPDFDPDTDTLFNLNTPYYVDGEEPVTLYAVWQVKVYFHLNKPTSEANWGGTWDSGVYTDESDVIKSRTVYINNPADPAPYDPRYTGADDLFFRYWGTQRYGSEDTIDEYDFSQPVTSELHLYAYWAGPIEVPIHAVDATLETLVDKDSVWLDAQVIRIMDTEISLASSSDADSYTDVDLNTYLFEHAFVHSSTAGIQSISEDEAITAVYYNSTDQKLYVRYADPGQPDAPMADEDEIYFVYYEKETLPIGYKSMDTDASLTTVPSSGPTVTGSMGDYSMQSSLTTPLSYPTGGNSFNYYAFAIGAVDTAGGISGSDLRLITATSGSNSSRPALTVRNTWRGFQYSTDGGSTWVSCGYDGDVQLYVIYFKTESQPSVVTINEVTRGLTADMSEKFEYVVVVTETKTTTTSVQRQRNGWSGWENYGSPTATTITTGPTEVSNNSDNPYLLSNGESQSVTLFDTTSIEPPTIGPEYGGGLFSPTYRDVTTVTTVTTQTITVTQRPKTGFTTDNTSTAGSRQSEMVWTYTTTGTAATPAVTYTNTHTPLEVEVHLGIVGAGGTITLADGSRLAAASPYKISLDLGGDAKTFLTEIPADSLYTAEGYGFAGVFYGTDDGSTVTTASAASTVTYGQIEEPNLYELILNGDNQNRLDENHIYYVFYPLPKLVYVKESSGGVLERIQGSVDGITVTDTITYNGGSVTLNGAAVAQEQLLPVTAAPFAISQTVAEGSFNMPPRLDDGTEKLFLLYTKIGTAGTEDAANADALATVTESKVLYLMVDGGQVKWSLDGSVWESFDGFAPTVYAIYKEIGYDLEITKTIAGDNVDPNRSFTLTITSPAITESSYAVTGTGYSTVSATPASGSEPGKIVLTIKHGSDITISGLGRGDYTLTESQEASMSAMIDGVIQTVQNNSMTITDLHANTKVDLTNEMKIPAPTGVDLDLGPWMTLLGFGLLVMGLLLMPKLLLNAAARADEPPPAHKSLSIIDGLSDRGNDTILKKIRKSASGKPKHEGTPTDGKCPDGPGSGEVR